MTNRLSPFFLLQMCADFHPASLYITAQFARLSRLHLNLNPEEEAIMAILAEGLRQLVHLEELSVILRGRPDLQDLQALIDTLPALPSLRAVYLKDMYYLCRTANITQDVAVQELLASLPRQYPLLRVVVDKR